MKKKTIVWMMLGAILVLLQVGSVVASEADYRVGPGDVIKVNVYDHADLTTTLRVSSGGSIQFPLVGKLAIAGQSVARVGETIAAALADGYIVNPQVSVFIEEFRSSKVTIMGQIGKPGLYELSGPTTLLELISKAGGLAREAGEKATIHRQSKGAKGGEKIIQINLKHLLEDGDSSQDSLLVDGDSVFVLKAGMAYITGEVGHPDSYKIEEGTTVIMAVTMAGGFTNLASKGRVKVIRKVDGEEKIFEKVPMNMVVMPDDVVVVPESFF